MILFNNSYWLVIVSKQFCLRCKPSQLVLAFVIRVIYCQVFINHHRENFQKAQPYNIEVINGSHERFLTFFHHCKEFIHMMALWCGNSFCATGLLWGQYIGESSVSLSLYSQTNEVVFVVNLNKVLQYCWIAYDLRCYDFLATSLWRIKSLKHLVHLPYDPLALDFRNSANSGTYMRACSIWIPPRH